jgi:hypothetical protein
LLLAWQTEEVSRVASGKRLADILQPLDSGVSDLHGLRVQFSRLTHELHSLDGEDFLLALIYKTIIGDILSNVAEDDYVRYEPMHGVVSELVRSWQVAAQVAEPAGWEQWADSMLSFADQYRQLPSFRNVVDITTVGGIKFFVASAEDPLVGPPLKDQSKDPTLKMFPNLDATLSDPVTARPIMRWYLDQVLDLQRAARSNGGEIQSICFIDKPYAGAGAVSAMGYLVDQLGMPGVIYRSGYWDPEARIRGTGPALGTQAILVTDVAIHGTALEEAVRFFLRRFNVMTVAALVIYDFGYDTADRLAEYNTQLVAKHTRTKLADELTARYQLLADLRRLRDEFYERAKPGGKRRLGVGNVERRLEEVLDRYREAAGRNESNE